MSPALIQEVIDDGEPAVSGSSIQLNDTEATLRRLLLDVAQHIEQSSTSQEAIVLRFTGGWVRDKLLGVPSHDIDVAISNLTGLQFGQQMLEYLQIPGNPEKYGLEGVATTEKQDQNAGKVDKSKMVRGLHKIAANPEKSKHLETVTTIVLGLDIDLVNLRKETYSKDSRNPQMEFGTPEEDAMRRDATVNAMFYNLNTQQLEDFTGQGLTDMRDKILRTPLDPYQTFMDDPLRVLRLIRFASRLGWSIDQIALDAMQQPDIKAALQRKISRERVGIELEKALRGPDPHEALRLILDLGLYETIFCDPAVDSTVETRPILNNSGHVIDALETILDSTDSLSTIAVRDSDERLIAWQLAALIPYRDAPLPEPPQAGRKAPPPIPAQVAREGIKATSKLCDVITASVRNLGEIRHLVDTFDQQSRKSADRIIGQNVTTRDYLGMKVRAWGPSWRSQATFALLADIADAPEHVNSYKRKYANFLEYLQKEELVDAYQLKPLLDGKTLAKALGTPPGPWMKDALDVVMAWQLRNPGQSDTKAAVEEVRQGELAFSLAEHFLKLTIRPLFIKAKPNSITEKGRKKTAASQYPVHSSSLDDTEMKPWKNAQNIYALDLLCWTVQRLNDRSVQQLWHLIIPPILTLLDDWETRYKALGAKLLEEVLLVTPSDLLKRTGLGSVFEDALLPCLTYLPPLTKEQESLALLSPVYQALVTLTDARFPIVSSSNHTIKQKTATILETSLGTSSKITSPIHASTTQETPLEALPIERVMSLDAIVRKGIIHGYTHTSQHFSIVIMLLQQLIILINELSIEFVKHLKFIMPMLGEVMSSPLATAQPTLLTTAASSTKAIIQNCWPRVAFHRGEILRGLTVCWLNLGDDKSDEARTMRRNLKECVTLLQDAIGGQVDLDADFDLLVHADARLRDLLR